jgi:hypothetical protein
VKFTVPVNPLDGVIVITEVAGCPAGTLRVDGEADILNGTVILTIAGEGEVELPFDVFPLYVAVTLLVPAGRALVENVAIPPDTDAIPRDVADPLL